MAVYAYLFLLLTALTVVPFVAAQDGPAAEDGEEATATCPADAEASDMDDFDCMKAFAFADDTPYMVHWSVDGTMLKMALVGQTEGWVGIAFPTTAGSMVPADFIIGYVDGDTVTVSPYFADSRAVNAFAVQNDVEVTDVGGEEAGGATTVYFTRDTSQDGTVPFGDLTAEMNINFATGTEDMLVYHMAKRNSGVITFSV